MRRTLSADALAKLVAELRETRAIISGRKRDVARARSALQSSLNYYTDLFDNAPLAYVTLDSQGVVTNLNGTGAKLLGRNRAATIGKPLAVFVDPADHTLFYEHMRRCRTEEAARSDLRLTGPQGSFPVEIDSRLAKEAAGSEPRFRTALIDLRERRRIEADRVQGQKTRELAEERERMLREANDAKDRFIAELSHELRTPLTPIVTALAGLKERSDVPPSLRATLEMMQRNVEVEARLIDDLLDVSRIAQNRLHVELAPVDAHEVVREVADTLDAEIRSHELALSLDLGARRSWVLADALRLRQIFWNLLLNAVRNTPRGGRIALQSTNVEREVRIAVRDSGVGIEPSRLEEIFAAFSREAPGRSGEGLGLGLSIVKGLVEAHHGRILALSPGRGQGSTFVVELPTVDAVPKANVRSTAPPPSPEELETPSGSRAPTRVLVVEDHSDTRDALEAYLRIKGYDVRLASDVASALREAREPVDVIVCDIGLPDGSGFDIVRSLEKPVKAIALTGYGAPQDVALASRAGFSAHLTKPIAVEELVATIESLTKSRDA